MLTPNAASTVKLSTCPSESAWCRKPVQDTTKDGVMEAGCKHFWKKCEHVPDQHS